MCFILECIFPAMYFILQYILSCNIFYLLMFCYPLVLILDILDLLRAKYETTSFVASYVNISPKLAGSKVIPKCIQNSQKLSCNSILHNMYPLQ